VIFNQILLAKTGRASESTTLPTITGELFAAFSDLTDVMNPLNPKKLLHSKWTAVAPLDRQKHFIVTKVLSDEQGLPQSCVLEAVYTHAETTLDWRSLRDSTVWKMGWQ
jgi:tryptophan-rich hypothetical protein